MSRALVVDNIGLLITNDPAAGAGPLGEVRAAAVVVSGGEVVAVTAAGAAGDDRIDVGGRCVVPGFVDSHTHLLFAGDRSAEFVARMAGAEYVAGGINVTTAATRAATDVELRRGLEKRLRESHAAGITTTEIKSGYGLSVAEEERGLRLASEAVDDTTFLGAHVVPPEFAGRIDDYVALVAGDMLAAAAPHARFVDAFCERGAFDADQCRRVLMAGRRVGLVPKVHANQLGPGPGVQLAVEMEAASADHCTYLSDHDIAALAGSTTVATFLPAADFSTRQPYPDARRVLDAGAVTALATNCNPGSSYTTSMSFCIALAVRDMRMTIDEALWAATAGGAAALRRADIGAVVPGKRADLTVLDAPSHHHLVYRPGVPLIHATIRGAKVVWSADPAHSAASAQGE